MRLELCFKSSQLFILSRDERCQLLLLRKINRDQRVTIHAVQIRNRSTIHARSMTSIEASCIHKMPMDTEEYTL